MLLYTNSRSIALIQQAATFDLLMATALTLSCMHFYVLQLVWCIEQTAAHHTMPPTPTPPTTIENWSEDFSKVFGDYIAQLLEKYERPWLFSLVD